ncbi:hypothetical protein SO694_00066199 [Aureococcus anophagefferens]|uniref:Uncharacterized protein n=1 Tax=Aureococcus anophagefferens TaxID=44056 RepID=A0ABR1FQC4_AURAN
MPRGARWRKKLDEEELKGVTCEKTAFLAHTWWDGPMVRVVAMFLRSFRATQHAQCAKLVVWTPGDGTERSTERGRALVEQVEAMSGAPVVFQTLHMEAAAGVPPARRFSRWSGARRGGEALIRHGGKLKGLGCCKGWGNTLWTAKVVKGLGNTYGLPCTAWDPFWLRMDGHHTGEMTRRR